jgi:hypothetical protein
LALFDFWYLYAATCGLWARTWRRAKGCWSELFWLEKTIARDVSSGRPASVTCSLISSYGDILTLDAVYR